MTVKTVTINIKYACVNYQKLSLSSDFRSWHCKLCYWAEEVEGGNGRGG